MAGHGCNPFRRYDDLGALKSAHDGGIAPAMIEFLAPKGTARTFRVHGDKMMTTPASAEPGVSKEWQDEID